MTTINSKAMTQEERVGELSKIINFNFTKPEDVERAYEALTHKTGHDIGQRENGNLDLSRMGHSAAQTAQHVAIYLAGSYNGAAMAAMMQTHHKTEAYASVCRNRGIAPLIRLGNGLETVSDNMAAEALQAVLGAVYLAGREEGLAGVLMHLGMMERPVGV